MALIAIASVTIPSWQGALSGVQLRIYTNASFTASSGTIYPMSVQANLASVGTFYQTYACTVASGALTIPAVTLDSTTDATDNPSATFSAVLWDTNSGNQIQSFGTQGRFALAPSPTSITWATIFSADIESGL